MTDHTTEQSTQEIPYGYCHCGCGQKTNIATVTVRKYGWIRGEPKRYIHGHSLHLNRKPGYESLEDAFWHHVEPAPWDSCWEWVGARATFGYGTMGYSNRQWLAHRASWIIHFGPIPDGMEVCHTCDNPSCVNPYHLFLGSHLDNMRDMATKGRHPMMGRITEEDVREIRRLAEGGMSQQKIAKHYGIVQQQVSRIVRRERWASVE